MSHIRFVQDQHDMLICSASSVKQLLVVRNVAPPDTISLKLSQQLFACTLYCEVFSEEAAKYQFYILWFDWTVTRTHDLPHSQLERLILHHRCGYDGHIENRLHVTKHIVLYITVTVAKYIELNGLIG
jgi:hypothetical protein